MDIEHSAISTIQRTGYPSPEYLEWELRVANEGYTEDEEIMPDGVTFGEWISTKKPSAGTESLVPSNLARNEY